jgi:hypothetical protein
MRDKPIHEACLDDRGAALRHGPCYVTRIAAG